MKSLADALRAIAPGELRHVRLPTAGASAKDAATALRQGLEHHLRARVTARLLEIGTDVERQWFDVSGRSLLALLAGAATVGEPPVALEPGGAVAANGPVRLGAAGPCTLVVCEIVAPTWREWLTEIYACRAAHVVEARRYAQRSSPAPSPPTATEIREGLRALARRWHGRRAGSAPHEGHEGHTDPGATPPVPASVLVRRPDAVLRIARAGGLCHLVCGRNPDTFAVGEEHEALLRFLMGRDRFERGDLPFEMSDEAFVAVAGRLLAIGAFQLA